MPTVTNAFPSLTRESLIPSRYVSRHDGVSNALHTQRLYGRLDLRLVAGTGSREGHAGRGSPSAPPARDRPQCLHTGEGWQPQCGGGLSAGRGLWDNIRYSCGITYDVDLSEDPVRIDGGDWRRSPESKS